MLVTGASGFIGSTLVRGLLDRGYNIRAGVLNPGQSMTRRRRTTSSRWPPAPERAASASSVATSSTAPRSSTPRGDARASSTSPPPAPSTPSRTPRHVLRRSAVALSPPARSPRRPALLCLLLQNQLMVPAVEGTLNVLRAAKAAGTVRRVVVTSSISAIVPSPGWPAGEVRDERCWTDIDYCEKNGAPQGYPTWAGESGGRGEEAHGARAADHPHGEDHQGCRGEPQEQRAHLLMDDKAETDHLLALAAGAGVEGRLRIFRCNLFDGAALLDAARGCSGVFHLASPCIIYAVSDPQKQLIVPAVEGTLNVLRAAKEAGSVRRVAVTSSISSIQVSMFPKDTQPGLVRAEVGAKKLVALGLQFSPLEKIIRDAVESLQSRGYIS
ncbi:hypothetical protein BAE44_0017292 [Dichanthelium oligosanthes]|uniref:NAD-dependent epimerase/dehydratase domain-containing protein n=1 Tax=Dichanthelium oligosanthes TaxID=888268 RepID=A0A1E5V955_9POAL|nr:hypothetical protein BAE44_0017292 [Dichanthelium oligosanthes]